MSKREQKKIMNSLWLEAADLYEKVKQKYPSRRRIINRSVIDANIDNPEIIKEIITDCQSILVGRIESGKHIRLCPHKFCN